MPELELLLTRRTRLGNNGDQGVCGDLSTPWGTIFKVMELPWRDNEPDISHVPCGRYKALWQWSDKWGRFKYHLQDVPGRSVIEQHVGNWAGDIRLGFKSDSDGCQLFGRNLVLGVPPEFVNAQWMVDQSRTAVLEFEEQMNGQPYWLTIEEKFQ